MIIVEMWLLGSLSGEATSTLSDVHTHACYCFFRTVSGTHASLACTAVLCRTSKLMGGGEKKNLNGKKRRQTSRSNKGNGISGKCVFVKLPIFQQ